MLKNFSEKYNEREKKRSGKREKGEKLRQKNMIVWENIYPAAAFKIKSVFEGMGRQDRSPVPVHGGQRPG